jgi:hypothetical protein
MTSYQTFDGRDQNAHLLSDEQHKSMAHSLLNPLRTGQKQYPIPLSTTWRSFHWLMYFNGGFTFFVGSFLLYSNINAAYASSVLYTFGSTTFLIADITEWLTNNHVGCFWYDDYEDSFEESVHQKFASKDSWEGKWQRAEVGWNFFLSSIGSFFYLVGSALFLPQFSSPVTALECFMVASSCIIVAQCWKVYRGGLGPEKSEVDVIAQHVPTSKKLVYSTENYKEDFSGFLVDFFVIFGAMGYLLGSPLFMPTVDTNNNVNDLAVTIFTFGGIFYMLSGMAMFYRYAFTQNYPH